MNKQAWRQKLRAHLKVITSLERRKWSSAIADHVCAIPEFREARTVMAFLSLPEELDTTPLLEQILCAGKTLAVPRMTWKSRGMTPVQLKSLNSTMTIAKGGVREPANAIEIDPASLDLVLVPGLGFDSRGTRLGRGAGFYDRFLATLPDTTVRCGLAYDIQFVSSLPAEGHDEDIHLVVTEQGISKFNRD